MKVFQTVLFAALFSLGAHATVNVKSLDFSSDKEQGRLVIKFDGSLKEYPELKVTNSVIQVLIPDSKIDKEINKKVSFSTKGKDTELSVSRFSGDSSRLRAVFPFEMNQYKDKVSLMIKDNKIELNFPRIEVKGKVVAAKSAPAKTTAPAPAKKAVPAKKEYLNEDYLNSLIKIENKKEKALEAKVIRPKMDIDEVKTTQAATAKAPVTNGKSSFSLLEYGGKFVAFLAVTLLMFYGIITLMKKGFIKKGKLGFLNKTEQIQVLSQTYIAPKKSLMMVRAHNQVFLVSNTDAGIHPISEIRDVAGFLKDGERKIAGDNFDDNLVSAQATTVEEKVKLKEDITQSNKQSSLSDYMGVKDKVKFSDQIKKKVKNLKPLH